MRADMFSLRRSIETIEARAEPRQFSTIPPFIWIPLLLDRLRRSLQFIGREDVNQVET